MNFDNEEDALGFINRLLERLNQADFTNQGSKIEFVYVASGGQHVETQVNIGAHRNTGLTPNPSPKGEGNLKGREKGAEDMPEPLATKEGYTFSGWSEIPKKMPAHDVTVTGNFTINQYKLTYLIDGTVYKTYTLDYDSVITPEGDIEDDDYYYAWEEIPERMPAHDVQVNAYITGIAAAGGIVTGTDSVKIYSLDGKRLHGLQKGVNIIRFQNGKTKKVVVK